MDNFLIILLVVVTGVLPVIYSYKSNKKLFKNYLFLLLCWSAFSSVSLGYGVDFCNELQLKRFHYNHEGMSEFEREYNVQPKNMTKVRQLYQSQNGLGWLLKSIFYFLFQLMMGLVGWMVYFFLGLLKRANGNRDDNA